MKLFGWTVIIIKNTKSTWEKRKPYTDEKVTYLSGNINSDILEKPDTIISKYVWDTIKYDLGISKKFSREVYYVDSLIPLIKMFREKYSKIRGIPPSLIASKEFIESKFTKSLISNKFIYTYSKRKDK